MSPAGAGISRAAAFSLSPASVPGPAQAPGVHGRPRCSPQGQTAVNTDTAGEHPSPPSSPAQPSGPGVQGVPGHPRGVGDEPSSDGPRREWGYRAG